MRRLFVILAPVGLLGGVIGCDCTHGRCDCDEPGYGCVACGCGWYGEGGAPYGAPVPPPAGDAHGYVSGPATTTTNSLASAPK
jgi:hypothetical protein